jgi:GNAT superfamily N-acetyltransferase
VIKKAITFRRATIKDTKLVVDMRIEFHEDFVGRQTAQKVASLRKKMTPLVRKLIKNGSYICWLAFLGEECVGTGGIIFRQRPGNFANQDGREGYIMSMYTRAKMQRKGIGTKILKNLLADSKRKGVRFVELHASPEGEQLYKKSGFHLHPEPTYRIRL